MIKYRSDTCIRLGSAHRSKDWKERNRFDNRFDKRLYRVYSRLWNRLYNPVWQPVERTAVRSTRLSIRLSNPFENRFDNRLMFVYTVQPVVKPVVQPFGQPVVSCKRGLSQQSRVGAVYVCPYHHAQLPCIIQDKIVLIINFSSLLRIVIIAHMPSRISIGSAVLQGLLLWQYSIGLQK